MENLKLYLTPDAAERVRKSEKKNGYLFTAGLNSEYYSLMALESNKYNCAFAYAFNDPDNRKRFKSDISIIPYNKDKEDRQTDILSLFDVDDFKTDKANRIDKFLKLKDEEIIFYAKGFLPVCTKNPMLLDMSKNIFYKSSSEFPEHARDIVEHDRKEIEKFLSEYNMPMMRQMIDNLFSYGKREGITDGHFNYLLGED